MRLHAEKVLKVSKVAILLIDLIVLTRVRATAMSFRAVRSKAARGKAQFRHLLGIWASKGLVLKIRMKT
jgi:hypothetical protein